MLHQPDDATDRCLGIWYVCPNNGGSIGCCNGNMCRALYLAWDSILESKGKDLWVNLGLNRVSPWADIDSHIPYEGKLRIRMKSARDRLLVRIPEWTEWNAVQCTINGRPRAHQWIAFPRGYVNLGAVAAGDEIIVQFPMKDMGSDGGVI